MANLSEDIQCASSDTRLPMLDKADFASWQQRIRLYCQGKENGVNILKSIDEGPFHMGTTRVIVAEGTEGSLNVGLERPRVYSDLSQDEKDRTIRHSNSNKHHTSSRLPKDIYSRLNHYTDAKDIWEAIFVTAVKLNKGLKDSNFDQLYAYLKQHEAHAKENKMMLERLTQQTVDPLALMSKFLDEEQLLFLAGGQDNAIDEDVDEQPVQDLALNVDNVFQDDDYDAYDSDVDEAPTAHTMFMANLSSADLVCDEAGPSYDSDVLSKVHDQDLYQDAVCDHHEEHEMHDDVQPNHVVDSHADYTSNSNMTPYDQYVKDNVVPVVQNNASMVPNDAYVMIDYDVHESDVLSVSHTTRNTVANNLLNAELATYKEQVEPL
ncbi:hypothetical protein Tco_0345862 [Tanacetum coccineum]